MENHLTYESLGVGRQDSSWELDLTLVDPHIYTSFLSDCAIFLDLGTHISQVLIWDRRKGGRLGVGLKLSLGLNRKEMWD